MDEQQALQEEVMEEEVSMEPGVAVGEIVNQLNTMITQIQGLQTTQAVLLRCLIDKGYVDTDALNRAHSMLIQESQEQQEKEQAQNMAPPPEGIMTGTGKLPIEEAPEVTI